MSKPETRQAVDTALGDDDAARAARDAARAADDAERAGLVVLGQYPAVVEKLVSMAERAARRLDQYGDVTAEATSSAVSMLARALAADGMPGDDDHRAALVASTAKRAAIHARDAARRVWAPRDKVTERQTTQRDAAADAAPNSLGRWTDAALIARAERYTSGDLSPRTRTVYAVTSSGQCEARTITTRSRVLAGAVLDQRDASSLASRRILTKSTARHAGGTSPAAESVYWRQRQALVTDVALESALALVGIPMQALTDLDTWHKSGTVAWQTLADKVGKPRGTVQRHTRGAAESARVLAKHRSYDPRDLVSPAPAQRFLIAP